MMLAKRRTAVLLLLAVGAHAFIGPAPLTQPLCQKQLTSTHVVGFTSSRSSIAAVRSSRPSAIVMSAAKSDVAKPKCDFRAIRR
jgi:hypothetical protein